MKLISIATWVQIWKSEIRDSFLYSRDFTFEFKVNFDSETNGKEIKKKTKKFSTDNWLHVTVKQTKENNYDGFATFVVQVQDATYTSEINENYDDIKHTSVTAMAGSTFWGSDYIGVPLRKIRFITEEMGKSF